MTHLGAVAVASGAAAAAALPPVGAFASVELPVEVVGFGV